MNCITCTVTIPGTNCFGCGRLVPATTEAQAIVRMGAAGLLNLVTSRSDAKVECPKCKGQGGTGGEDRPVEGTYGLTVSPEDLQTYTTPYHPCDLCQGYGALTAADLAAYDRHIQGV